MPPRTPLPPLTEQQRQLAADNWKLVPWVARRWFGDDPERDDIEGEGHLALIRAARRFDAGRGFRFSTYATFVVLRAMRVFIRRHAIEQQRRREYHDDELLNVVDGQWRPAVNIEDPGEWRDLHRVLNAIDPRARHALIGSVVHGRLLREIAKDLGVSRERARQLALKGAEDTRRAMAHA